MADKEETYIVTRDTKTSPYSKGPEQQILGIELVEEGSPTLNLEFESPAQVAEVIEALLGVLLMDCAHKHSFVDVVHSEVGCKPTHKMLKAAKNKLDNFIDEEGSKPH